MLSNQKRDLVPYIIDTEDNKFFAFTYKKNVAHTQCVAKEDYVHVVKHIVDSKIIIRQMYYELDTRGNFHVHGIAYAPTNLRYSTLKVPGFTSRWNMIYDFTGWELYIKKDQDDEGSIDVPDDSVLISKLKASLFKQ